MVDVSVIVPCKNMELTLGETLDGIAAQVWDRPWEVLLVDNGSTDRTAEIFHEFAAAHPETSTRYVDASAGRGKPFALNLGVAAAEGRAILLNDADDVMEPGYVAIMGAALDTHDLVGGGNSFARLNEGWVRTYRGFPAEVRNLPRSWFPPHLPFVAGNSMGFTKTLFERIGGFRTDLGNLDDLEFCFRAQQAGFEVTFVPEATIHYRHRTDPVAIRRQAYEYALWGVLLAKTYGSPRASLSHGWRPMYRGWKDIARISARQALSRRQMGEGERALLAYKLGHQLGKTAGALRFRAAPY